MKTAKKRPSIVLVDDEADFRMVVERSLEDRFDVAGLPDGEGLLDTLEGVEADALILDVHLAASDGFALCRRVRSDPRFEDLPILFLTGSKEDSDFVRNMDSGGTAYLTKPLSPRELKATLLELCGVAPRTELARPIADVRPHRGAKRT